MATSESTAIAPPELSPLQPVTLVSRVVDAIVKGAAEGVFPPGERVVEAEVARRLEVSRVPVREALRLLESQGVVINEPYRGMRMMDVTRERVKQTLSVRLALEQLAVTELRTLKRQHKLKDELLETVEKMAVAERANEPFEMSRLDMDFHRQMVEATANPALVRAWEPLARQLVIMIRLSANNKPLSSITAEHAELAEGLCTYSAPALQKLLHEHILAYLNEIGG